MGMKRTKTSIDRYIVRDGKSFRLKHVDPDDTGRFRLDKTLASQALPSLFELELDISDINKIA